MLQEKLKQIENSLAPFLPIVTIGILISIVYIIYTTPKILSDTNQTSSILVTIHSPNLQTELLDERVIKNIEHEFNSISEIKEFSTKIQDKQSLISIIPKKRIDISRLANLLEQKLTSLRNQYDITFSTTIEIPEPENHLWEYKLIAQKDDPDISKIALQLEKKLSQTDCIEKLEIMGHTQETIIIKPKLSTLQTYQISPPNLIQQIQKNNTNLSIEALKTRQTPYQITLDNTLVDIENLRHTIIQTQDRPILLNEIANVVYQNQNETPIRRYDKNLNSQNIVHFRILGKNNCDILITDRNITNQISDFKLEFQNITIETLNTSVSAFKSKVLFSLVLLASIFILSSAFLPKIYKTLYPTTFLIYLGLYLIILKIFYGFITSLNIDIVIFTSILSLLIFQINPQIQFKQIINTLLYTIIAQLFVLIFFYFFHYTYVDSIFSLTISTCTFAIALIFSHVTQKPEKFQTNYPPILAKFIIFGLIILYFYNLTVKPSLNMNFIPQSIKYINIFVFIILIILTTNIIYRTQLSIPKLKVTLHKNLTNSIIKFFKTLKLSFSKTLRQIFYNVSNIKALYYFLIGSLVLIALYTFINATIHSTLHDPTTLYLNIYPAKTLTSDQFNDKISETIELILQLPEVSQVDYYKGYEYSPNQGLEKNLNSVYLEYKIKDSSQIKRSRKAIQNELQKILSKDTNITVFTDEVYPYLFHIDIISHSLEQSETDVLNILEVLSSQEYFVPMSNSTENNKIQNINIQLSPFELSKRGITNQEIGNWLEIIVQGTYVTTIRSLHNNTTIPVYISFDEELSLSSISEFIVYTDHQEYSIAEIATINLKENHTKIYKINDKYIQNIIFLSENPAKLLDELKIYNLLSTINDRDKKPINFKINERINTENNPVHFFTFGLVLSLIIIFILVIQIQNKTGLLVFSITSVVNMILIWNLRNYFSNQSSIYISFVLNSLYCLLTISLLNLSITRLFKTSKNYIQSVLKTTENSFWLISIPALVSFIFFIFCLYGQYVSLINSSVQILILSVNIIIVLIFYPIITTYKHHTDKINHK